MSDTQIQDWRTIIVDIHGMGVPYRTLARKFGVLTNTVKLWAYGHHQARLSYEQGLWLLKLREVLVDAKPSSFRRPSEPAPHG
jgi:hypothetical protein